MKKILFSAFAAAMSAAAFAGMNNVVISFSTPGIDRYSDGTVVRDGEKYALVWTPDNGTFDGINANGKAAGESSKVVASVPAALNGRCQRVQFQVDEDYVASNFKGGTWSVVMLDTRVFRFDGEGKVVLVDGKRDVVSVGDGNPVIGYGVVGVPQIAKGGEVGTAGGVAAASSVAASDAPAPKVDKIDFDENDNVRVWISSAKSAFKYDLMAGDTPAEVTKTADSGYGTATDTLILVTPKKSGGEFFKVNCKYE